MEYQPRYLTDVKVGDGATFSHARKVFFATIKIHGIDDIAINEPPNMLYTDKNPFG